MKEELAKQLTKFLIQGKFASHEDLKDLMDFFLKLTKEAIARLESKIETENGNKEREIKNIVQNIDYLKKEIERNINTTQDINKKEISDLVSKFNQDIKILKDSIPETEEIDTSEIENSISEILLRIKSLEDVKKLSPDDIKSYLESIKPEEKKLKIEAISFLRKEIDEIKSQIKSINLLGNRPIFGAARTRFIDDETPDGIKDGSNTIFTLSKVPLDNSLKLYRGGARQRETEDYTISGRTITFIIAVLPTEILLADYRY